MLAELTATPRVGVHRYTFEGSEPAHIWIDLSSALGGRGRSTQGQVRVKPETREVEGQIRTFGTFASRYGGVKVHFVARFDRPFIGFGTWRGDAISTNQPNAEGDQVGVDLQFSNSDQAAAVTLVALLARALTQAAAAWVLSCVFVRFLEADL